MPHTTRVNRLLRLFVPIVLLALPAGARENLVLGVSGGANTAATQREMASVLRHLNTSTDLSVTLKVFESHEDLYAAFHDGKVDLALLGPVKYVQAHHELGAVPVVAEGPEVRGIIAVAPKSPITKIEQLRGRKVAFGYKDSTSTHLIPLLILSKNGIRERDITPMFLGDVQNDLAEAVLAGRADACALSATAYERQRGKLRVLAESDPFPGPPVVAHKTLSAAALAEVRRMFLSYKASASDGQRFGKGATAVTDSDFNRVRFLVKSLYNKMYL